MAETAVKGETKVAAEIREDLGTQPAKRLRRAGRIPAVVYGAGGETVHLSTDGRILGRVLEGGGHLLDLSYGSADEKVLIEEVQTDPVSDKLLHVDFRRVAMDKAVQVSVEIHLKGEAAGMKEGGVLEQSLHEIEIECMPDRIPDEIVARIDTLAMGDSLHIGDLTLPDGVKVLDDPQTVIASIQHPKRSEDVEAAAEGEPGPGEPEVIGAKEKDEEGEKEGEEPAGKKE